MNNRNEKNLIETISESNINVYDPTDKTKFKNVQLFKEEDRQKYDEFSKIFIQFLSSDDQTMLVDKFPRFFINYIINNLQEDIRKQIYFSYEIIDEYI
jgi:hypothetical protein